MTTKTALVVTDIQNDFLPGGALAVPAGDQVILVANRLMSRFDLVIATQDWHPADHGSFAANHPDKKVGDVIDLDGIRQILWPVHCVQGSRGAELVAGLKTNRMNRIFRKGTDPGTDSYSGLFDNGHRKSTGLAEFLHEQEVTDVYIVGLATEYCVKFTALDAIAAGFVTHLIEDGCRGVNLRTGDDQRAIEEMRQAGVKVLRSNELSNQRATHGYKTSNQDQQVSQPRATPRAAVHWHHAGPGRMGGNRQLAWRDGPTRFCDN